MSEKLKSISEIQTLFNSIRLEWQENNLNGIDRRNHIKINYDILKEIFLDLNKEQHALISMNFLELVSGTQSQADAAKKAHIKKAENSSLTVLNSRR